MVRQCGFDNVRRDAQGYYCSCCGERMSEGYEDMVRYTLPKVWFARLQAQSKAGN